jgi:hypothetical protein
MATKHPTMFVRLLASLIPHISSHPYVDLTNEELEECIHEIDAQLANFGELYTFA